jgi:hypothetical protein
VLWNPLKPRKELILDVGFVILIQAAALVYGLHTVVEARPVWLVFEVDRFRLVTAAEVMVEDLPSAPHSLQKLSWTGPRLIGVRESGSGEETLRSIELSLAGQEPSLRPGWWRSYEDSRSDVQRRMQPLIALHTSRSEQQQAEIDSAVKKTHRTIDQLRYLPLVSRKSLDDWIVLLDQEASIVGYAAVGGFEN